MWIKTCLKLLLIGVAATICRIIGQLLIPDGNQDVLAPSIFAENGTMPLAFTIYGVFAYSAIASMFCLIRGKMTGSKLLQGLKYGLSCCVIWILYLLEPLPHVALSDKITYPLADSAALLVMGLLCGLLLGKRAHKAPQKLELPAASFLAIVALFAAGRAVMYNALDIYSMYSTNTAETALWTVLTGAAISLTIHWWYKYIPPAGRYARALLLGGLLFGADLLLFNFFMPLVFSADIPDLIIRTVLDVLFVSIGCLALKDRKNPAA